MQLRTIAAIIAPLAVVLLLVAAVPAFAKPVPPKQTSYNDVFHGEFVLSNYDVDYVLHVNAKVTDSGNGAPKCDLDARVHLVGTSDKGRDDRGHDDRGHGKTVTEDGRLNIDNAPMHLGGYAYGVYSLVSPLKVEILDKNVTFVITLTYGNGKIKGQCVVQK
jgi:hypothetical protein